MFKELLGEAFPIVEKVAPVIAQAIGGPYVGTAAAAMSILAKAFGNDEFDFSNLSQKILNDPGAEDKLHGMASSFGVSMVNAFQKYLPSKAEMNIKLEWIKSENNT